MTDRPKRPRSLDDSRERHRKQFLLSTTPVPLLLLGAAQMAGGGKTIHTTTISPTSAKWHIHGQRGHGSVLKREGEQHSYSPLSDGAIDIRRLVHFLRGQERAHPPPRAQRVRVRLNNRVRDEGSDRQRFRRTKKHHGWR